MLPFGGFFLNLFGTMIARRIGEKIATPVQKVTHQYQGSRTLTVANWGIISGILLAISQPLSGVDWSAIIGPVWGGLLVAVCSIIVGVLRIITNGPHK